MKRIIVFLFTLVIIVQSAKAQDQHELDSLQRSLDKYRATKMQLRANKLTPQDSTEADLLEALGSIHMSNDLSKSMEYEKQSLALATKLDYKYGIGNALDDIGTIYNIQGDLKNALYYYNQAIKPRTEINDLRGVAISYNNIGSLYMSRGEYPLALKFFFDALKINEQTGNKLNQATNLGNIGSIYLELGNIKDALKYQLASLKCYDEESDQKGIAQCHYNLSNIYQVSKDYPSALAHSLSCLKISKDINDKESIAYSKLSLALVYIGMNKSNEALNNLLPALEIAEQLQNKNLITSISLGIGESYMYLRDFVKSSHYLKQALVVAKEIGSLADLRNIHGFLSVTDSALGHYLSALENYKLSIKYKDSIANTENTKKQLQLQMQYDFDKKEGIAKAISENELNEQRNYIYISVAVLCTVLLLLFFVFRNYKKQKLANKILKETQHQLLESEKLAAFGVVATRVAHEIQNPLNFVNNFSRLSSELMEEYIDAKTDEEKAEIYNNLSANLEKINHHGNRADDIVKQLFVHMKAGTTHEYFEEEKG